MKLKFDSLSLCSSLEVTLTGSGIVSFPLVVIITKLPLKKLFLLLINERTYDHVAATFHKIEAQKL